VIAKFDQRQGSSDGGAILLKAADRRLGLTSALAACLREERQPGKILHEMEELLTQRVMGMALGYEDANDAARLACDPVHKLLVGRDPIDGEDLASQPTLSRFENAPDRQELLRIARRWRTASSRAIANGCMAAPAASPSIWTRPTTPRTASNSSPFSIATTIATVICRWSAFLTFNDEAEQYLVAAVLRPGNVSGSCGAIGILRRLLRRLDSAFPGALFRVRLDGGFAAPEVLEF